MVSLYFNQTDAAELEASVSWIAEQAVIFQAEGARILWSVPFPGPGQLEAVAQGVHDALYAGLFQAILAVSPDDSSDIHVRLPWGFNVEGGANAAIDKFGNWNGRLFVRAWRRLSKLARAESPRFMRIWCPNVTTMSLDPKTCWPGKAHVDILAQDFFMKSAWNQPGEFSWFLNERRGLNWAAKAARRLGKPYGLSEFGMDDDAFSGDLDAAAVWFLSLGSLAHHQCWWDRADGDDCRISDGSHPALAESYRGAFL